MVEALKEVPLLPVPSCSSEAAQEIKSEMEDFENEDRLAEH
jgi:hypothetical protein